MTATEFQERELETSRNGRRRPSRLERMTFRTSREMDFLSEKELCAQTGHHREEWPAVIVKELLDNALDACEEADIPPEITVAADETGITVADNGPGLPEATVSSILDFTIRVSSREAYCGPTRGAQGNALKTLVGMPRVLDPEQGRLVITTRGIVHTIACRPDAVTQRASFDVEKTKVSGEGNESDFYKSGTTIRIQWAPLHGDFGVAWPFDKEREAETNSIQLDGLLRGYALFNPHLTLTIDWFGTRTTFNATDCSWKKWKPCHPTSPHWYQLPHLKRLVGAYIAHGLETGTDRTVADFLREFDGLTGSRKRSVVIDQTGTKRMRLSELASEHDLRDDLIDKLLDAMKANSTPVHPRRLGQIGREHFTQRLLEFGCLPESIDFKVRKRCDDGIPFVLESAFGYLGKDKRRRQIYAGANWSAGIKNPFRSFGATGEGLESLLSNQYAGRLEPIVFALHLAHPRVEYTDRGKSAIVVRE